MKKIAIIGAGFAGLATAWYLLEQKRHAITLFDAKGVGGGASGIAAGLMHPYAGKEAKLTQDALLAMRETAELLEIASETLGEAVYQANGMLRLAHDEEQRSDFFTCASRFSDVEWQEPFAPYPFPGIFIQNAITVDCPLYLKGLFRACQARGLEFRQQKIHTLREVEEYDLAIFATGAETFPELSHIPISQVKGQILTLKWDEKLPKPAMPLNSKAYLIMQNGGRCLVGSTFEHTFTSPLPDLAYAKQDLLPKIAPLYPELNEVLECRAGLRASTPSRKPHIRQAGPKCWFYAGLGSKGLLYHAHFAKILNKQLNI